MLTIAMLREIIKDVSGELLVYIGTDGSNFELPDPGVSGELILGPSCDPYGSPLPYEQTNGENRIFVLLGPKFLDDPVGNPV